VVENLVENLKFNFSNASMTENVTFFGQKNHLLVVKNLIENLKKKIQIFKKKICHIFAFMTENVTFFGQKKSYFGGRKSSRKSEKKIQIFKKKIVTYLHL
jgi:hypothetical protein